MPCSNRILKTRYRADARQVRNFVHRDAPEPGGCARPRVHGRNRASQSRRHRNGAGPVHQRLRRSLRTSSSIDVERTSKITASDTSKVPNASATAASSGSDINGKAAQAAAAQNPARRLVEFACRVTIRQSTKADVRIRSQPRCIVGDRAGLGSDELVHQAWFARVSLSATGFLPDAEDSTTIAVDVQRKAISSITLMAQPFAEVVIDTLDRRKSNDACRYPPRLWPVAESRHRPRPGRGRIRIQGAGWLTTEELRWNDDGELTDACTVDVQDPDVLLGSRPEDFRVSPCSSPPRTVRNSDLSVKGGRRAAADACIVRVSRDSRCQWPAPVTITFAPIARWRPQRPSRCFVRSNWVKTTSERSWIDDLSAS